MRDSALALLALTLAVGVVACGSSEEPTANPNAAPPAVAAQPGSTAGGTVGNLRLVDVDLGRSVNADHTMHDATSLFIPTDKVWATVAIEGSGPKASLQARWIASDGKVVDQQTQDVTPSGRTVAAFGSEHGGGWPIGQYRVDILLNGVQVGTKGFEVRQPPL